MTDHLGLRNEISNSLRIIVKSLSVRKAARFRAFAFIEPANNELA